MPECHSGGKCKDWLDLTMEVFGMILPMEVFGMILPRPGKWSSASGRFFIWERLYKRGGGATILCRVSLRYLKTAREISKDMAVVNEPIKI